MSKLKEKLMLSEKGYSDLKKAITACTITNIALLLPSMVACLLFWELLKPFTGETISWAALWKLLGLGLVAAILVFLAAKNDYRKTYIASYKEASTTRLRIAEHLRKLPMSFFNTKDLSDITTNMMADCSSMESMLSSTIPPLIANIISVTVVDADQILVLDNGRLVEHGTHDELMKKNGLYHKLFHIQQESLGWAV